MFLLSNVLLPAIVLPAVAAALVVLGLRGRSGPRAGAAGAAVGAGFLVGFVAVSGWPRWLPVEATQRLFFVVLVLGLISVPLARARSGGVTVAAEIAAAVALLPLLLWALIEHAWSPGAAAAWLLALLCLCLVTSRAMGAAVEREVPDLPRYLVRWALLAVTAVVLGLSDSLRLALLAGALGSGVAVVDLLETRGLVAWQRSDGLVVSTALAGLLLVGHFYAGLSGAVAVLVVIAIVLSALSRQRSTAARLSPLVPLLLALGLTLVTFLRSADDPYDYSAAPAATQSGGLAHRA